jgi:photosystem II stability/assembly factor-like uncharacterized protein
MSQNRWQKATNPPAPVRGFFQTSTGTLLADATTGRYRLNVKSSQWEIIPKFPLGVITQTRGGRLIVCRTYISTSDDEGKTWQRRSSVPTTYTGMTMLPQTNVVLVSSNNGVERSVDNGTIFTASNNGLQNKSVASIYAHPYNTNVVYAGVSGTINSGVYASLDGGQNWNLRLNTSHLGGVTAVLVSTLGTIVAITPQKIFCSADNAQTWKEIRISPIPSTMLSLDECHGAIYLGTNQGSYKSDDDGVTWKILSTPFTHTESTTSFFATDSTVYAGSEEGVFRSTDEGATWKPYSQGIFEVSFLGYHKTTLFYDTRRFISVDNGDTWKMLSKAPNHAGIEIQTVLPNDTYLGSDVAERKLWTSQDSGASWKNLKFSIIHPDTSNIFRLISSTSGSIAIVYHRLPNSTKQHYLQSSSAYIAFSSDNGQQWTNTPLRFLPDSSFISWVAFGKNNVLFIHTLSQGLYRSADSGKTFIKLSFMANSNTPFVVDPRGILMLSSERQLHTSLDNGVTWQTVSTTTVTSINAGALNSEGGYFFTDYGQVFKFLFNSRSLEKSLYFNAIDYVNNVPSGIDNFFQTSPDQIFAVGRNTKYIHRTQNGGLSWSLLTDGLPQTLLEIFSSAQTSSRIHISTTEGIYHFDAAKTSSTEHQFHDKQHLVSIFPNPVTNFANIKFTMPSASLVGMTLHDAIGREVMRLPEQMYGAGGHQVSLAMGALPTGIYFLRCSIGGKVVVRQVAVVR